MEEKYQKNYTQWIFIWMVCNAKCGFCNTQFPKDGVKNYFSFRSFEEIINQIDIYVQSWVECIIYEGGEFSIHPDIFRILRYGNTLGVKQTFQTNGIKLAQVDFVKKLKEYGITEVNFSLHASHADISNKIMWIPWAFDKTLKGIHNCNVFGITTSINFVILQENIDQICWILFSAFKMNIDLLNLILYIPPELWNDNFHKQFLPDPKKVGKELWKMLQILEDIERISKWKLHLNIKLHNIPRCIIPGEFDFHRELLYDVFRRQESYEKATGFYMKKECKKCKFYLDCPGITEYYIHTYGEEILHPIT